MKNNSNKITLAYVVILIIVAYVAHKLVFGYFTISSIDKHHHEGAILLRVEARPREDVLRHTINLVKEAAHPECIEIAQYGLRGGTNKAVMEFAVSSSTCQDKVILGNTLVNRLGQCDEILLIRQVSGTKYTLSQ